MEKIKKILSDLNISEDQYYMHGENIAKLRINSFEKKKKKAKLILMTSINPTPAGEGKTTTAIGLADGLNYIGKKAILALREPSLGPVFGRKGTATGGGESEITPTEEINLHFTGDFHAITTANNIISAAIDSEIYWNKLNIDHNRVVWKRCLDLNDRALREVEIKITKTISRKEEFTITAASNMMTILSLAKNENDLRDRISNSIVAYTKDDKQIFTKDLDVVGSVMAILKQAINPNAVLTKYNSLSIVHCGPFANIAIGTNSIISTQLAMKLGDYAIVESGFGSDLGFEKFMNLVNYENNLIPDCVVMVVTLRSLNLHRDFENNFYHLKMHLEHVDKYNLNQVVAINVIKGDDLNQLTKLQRWLSENNYQWELNEAYSKGPIGSEKLAKKITNICENKNKYHELIGKDLTIKNKITKIVKEFYYLKEVSFSKSALEEINHIQNTKYNTYPICMVKSHSSIDGNDKKEDNYLLEISNVIVNTGARFILAYTNKVMSMPGLSKDANYKSIDLVNDEIINLK